MSIEFFADTVTEMTARSHGNQQLSLKSLAMLHRSDKQKKESSFCSGAEQKLLLFRSCLNEYSDGEGGGWRIGKGAVVSARWAEQYKEAHADQHHGKITISEVWLVG